MPSYTEEKTGQAERLSGHFDSIRKEKTVDSETQDLPMHIHAPKSQALDGVKGHGFMTKAVEHLNRETQRGEHAPTVGGYKHDHTMR
jgi:hypothetical protein